MRLSLVVLPVTLLLTAFPSASGQSDSTASTVAGPRSATAGVYSAAQAERGRTVHREECTGCHGATAYIGEGFDSLWRGLSIFDVFEQIRTTMPDDNPGRLERAQYVDVIAYILSLNGFAAGAEELPMEESALRNIVIDSIPLGMVITTLRPTHR